MKYYYFTVTERIKPEAWNGDRRKRDEPRQDDYLFSFVEKISTSCNIANYFGDREIVTLNLFEGGKKKAEEITNFWNECYKKNGTYAY